MRRNANILTVAAACAVGLSTLTITAALSQTAADQTASQSAAAPAASSVADTQPSKVTRTGAPADTKRKRHWFTAWLNKGSDDAQAADDKSLFLGADKYNAQRQYIPDWDPDEFIQVPGSMR